MKSKLFLKCIIVSFVFVLTSYFILSCLVKTYSGNIYCLPNYDYIHEIKQLKKEKKLHEALKITEFILKNPDMPGQKEAQILNTELNSEINSFFNKTKRFSKGFLLGSVNSLEESGGAFISDLFLYGDVRDLSVQAYNKITGKETDLLIASLAGIGLLTEVIEGMDWIIAAFKTLQKNNALTKRFSDFIISACKTSKEVNKINPLLKGTFKNTQILLKKVGFSRGKEIFKHVETPSDLKAITKLAQKNSDTAYLIVKNGRQNGIEIIKKLGVNDDSVPLLSLASKKGLPGITFLKKIRLTSRGLKIYRLGHFEKFVVQLFNKYKWIPWMILPITIFISLNTGKKAYKILKKGRNKK